MVKDVEELGAETKSQLLGQTKLPLQRNVCLCCPEPAQDVASETSLLPCGWCGKSYLAENIGARILGGVDSGECVQEGTLRCF
jgi:hypothetical protein